MGSALDMGLESDGGANEEHGEAAEQSGNDINNDSGNGSETSENNGSENGSGNGQENGNADHWSNGLPDDLGTVKIKGEDGIEKEISIREHPILQKYGSVNDAVKGLVHAQSLIGKKSAPIPGEDASEEDRAKFWNELGRPEAADGYTIEGVQLPEGVQIQNDEVLEQIKAFCHENNYTQEHFAAGLQLIGSFYADQAADAKNSAEAKAAQTVQQLRAEWGSQSKANFQAAEKAARALGGDELIKELGETGGFNSPAVIKALHKVSGMLGEDKFNGGGGNPKPAYSRAQLESMQADPRYADPEQRDLDFVAKVENGWKAVLAAEKKN